MQVRLGAGSPAGRWRCFCLVLQHPKTYLIRIPGYIRVYVRGGNLLSRIAAGPEKAAMQHAAGKWEMRTQRTITTFPGSHSHSGVVIGPQQAIYVPPEQFRACCGRYLALNIIELAFLSLHSWRIASYIDLRMCIRFQSSSKCLIKMAGAHHRRPTLGVWPLAPYL